MTEATAPAPAPPALTTRLRGISWRAYGLPLAFLILLIVGSFMSPNFLTGSNMLNILVQSATTGVIAVGMTYVILTGGIDLSVGSVVGLASVSAVLVQDQGTLVMVIVALGVGALAGVVNGSLVTVGRIVPFIATLAMLAIARGLALFMVDSSPKRITDETYIQIGAGRLTDILPFDLPYAVIIFAAVAALGWFGLSRTILGRRLYAVGGNAEAARLSGVPVRRSIFSAYVICGVGAGIGALLVSSRTATGDPIAGDGFELNAIAAVVVGGTSLFGGRGTMFGTIIGVLILTTIQNLLTLTNQQFSAQLMIKGAIILAAVLLQRRAEEEG